VFGTSLGGLKALSTVLAAIPATFAAPIIAVQHRAADSSGQPLAPLLQAHTRLTIREADDKMLLEPGTVYLAPADYHLLVEAPGLLALSTDAPVRAARPSIDVCFETAAEAYGAALLAVLLTGASTDGAAGVAAVKARGGRVMIQDPMTAESRVMPAAGIAAASVDYIVPLAEIGRRVAGLVEGSPV
jgi:two-component system chemotaxis response regulator CheB